jgi:hypothetical protein
MASVINLRTVSGPPLDWLIAKLNKITPVLTSDVLEPGQIVLSTYSPSTDEALGEQMIKKFDITVVKQSKGAFLAKSKSGIEVIGSTRLVAAMRCIIMSERSLHVQAPEWTVRAQPAKLQNSAAA